ncbi:MAG: collagen-like protein [Treponema sp.]|nr:collagen-like protein [Treponema sp.]
MKKYTALVTGIALSALVFTACNLLAGDDGSAGSAGLAGPAGPAGTPGSGDTVTFTIPSACPLLSGSAGFPGYTVWKGDLIAHWYKFPDDGKTFLLSSDTTNGVDGTWETWHIIHCMERTDFDIGLGAAYPTWVIEIYTAYLEIELWQVNGSNAYRSLGFGSAYSYTKQP